MTATKTIHSNRRNQERLKRPRPPAARPRSSAQARERTARLALESRVTCALRLYQSAAAAAIAPLAKFTQYSERMNAWLNIY